MLQPTFLQKCRSMKKTMVALTFSTNVSVTIEVIAMGLLPL